LLDSLLQELGTCFSEFFDTSVSTHNTHTDMAAENNIQAVKISQDVCEYTKEVVSKIFDTIMNLKLLE